MEKKRKVREGKKRESFQKQVSQLEKVSSRIKQTEMCLKIAEESILKGNYDLKKLFFRKVFK